MRAIVEPTSHPPGLRRSRQWFRKDRGEEVCSRTSKRVIRSKDVEAEAGGEVEVEVEMDPDVVGVDEDEGGELDLETRSSREQFSYRNLPVCRCEQRVGSLRACERASSIIAGEGSIARSEDTREDVAPDISL